jgi:hypothetical protein
VQTESGRPDSRHDLFYRSSLQQEAGRPGFQGRTHHIFLLEGREDEDLGIPMAGAYSVCGSHSVHLGHDQVHEHHVRLQFGAQAHGFRTVGRLTYDLHVIASPKECAKSTAHYRMVIYHQDSYALRRRPIIPYAASVKRRLHLLSQCSMIYVLGCRLAQATHV